MKVKRQLAVMQWSPLQYLQSCCVYRLLSSKRLLSNGAPMAGNVGRCEQRLPCAYAEMRLQK